MKFHLETFDRRVGGCPSSYFSASLYTRDDGENDLAFGDWSDPSRYVTVATRPDGELAGLQVYDVVRGVLLMHVLWVAPPFRGRGLSEDMFEVSLSVEPVQRVSMYCISPASVIVGNRVAEAYPHLNWNIEISPFLTGERKAS